MKISPVSATSNKSRILLLMMMVIALVFFITSFLAASLTGPPPATTVGTTDTQASSGSCNYVRTGDGQYYGDCLFASP